MAGGVTGSAHGSHDHWHDGYHGHGHYDSCYHSYWGCWWDPCYSACYPYYSYYSPCWSSAWNCYGGCGPFGWSVSLWYPWWSWCSSYWNSCYSDCWYSSWSHPYCGAASYWWYPSTTYCPVYLSVPGSVVVESGEGEPPAAQPASGETIVAGGHVAGSASSPEVPAADAGGGEADSLAKKYVELGDFYFKAGRFLDAADSYGRARTYAPNDASVHFVMADAAFATGDYHFAAFLISEAVRLDPNIVSAEADKRLFYGDAKDFDTQMAELERYLEAKPYDAQAQLVRGYNLRFSGRSTDAIAAFQRVLEIAPDNRVAQAFLAALQPKPAEAPTGR